MLLRENLKQIVRLLLLNAFALNEPVLTFLIHEIYADCPSLFESLLSRFEQKELIDDNEFELWIVFSLEHKRSSTIDRLALKYCRKVFNLSTKASADNRIMSKDFKTALRNAYSIDYRMSHVMHFENSAIQWCKKLTFYDSISERRVTLVMNDYVKFRDQEMTRLNHLFVQKLNFARRLFANIFRVVKIDERNEILNLSLLHYTAQSEKWDIVDLSTIRFKKLYILSVKKNRDSKCLTLDKEDENDENDDRQLLLMKWVLQYL